MTTQELIEEVRLNVSAAGLLSLELNDEQLALVIKLTLRELERYWDETSLVMLPFSSCIDYGNCDVFKEKVSSIVKIYRTDNYGEGAGMQDPFYAQQWMLFSNGGTMYNLNDYILNYASWTTLLKIKNTMSTELSFKEDKRAGKLYINNAMSTPKMITIEYIPKITSIEDIKDEYWIDIAVRLATARTKIALGQARTRFTQSNAPYTHDGEKMREEGNTELKELLDTLRANSNLIYPTD